MSGREEKDTETEGNDEERSGRPEEEERKREESNAGLGKSIESGEKVAGAILLEFNTSEDTSLTLDKPDLGP